MKNFLLNQFERLIISQDFALNSDMYFYKKSKKYIDLDISQKLEVEKTNYDLRKKNESFQIEQQIKFDEVFLEDFNQYIDSDLHMDRVFQGIGLSHQLFKMIGDINLDNLNINNFYMGLLNNEEIDKILIEVVNNEDFQKELDLKINQEIRDSKLALNYVGAENISNYLPLILFKQPYNVISQQKKIGFFNKDRLLYAFVYSMLISKNLIEKENAKGIDGILKIIFAYYLTYYAIYHIYNSFYEEVLYKMIGDSINNKDVVSHFYLTNIKKNHIHLNLLFKKYHDKVFQTLCDRMGLMTPDNNNIIEAIVNDTKVKNKRYKIIMKSIYYPMFMLLKSMDLVEITKGKKLLQSYGLNNEDLISINNTSKSTVNKIFGILK